MGPSPSTQKEQQSMLDNFVPEDNETNDNTVHKLIREQVKEPVDTEDDKPLLRRNSMW